MIITDYLNCPYCGIEKRYILSTDIVDNYDGELYAYIMDRHITASGGKIFVYIKRGVSINPTPLNNGYLIAKYRFNKI